MVNKMGGNWFQGMGSDVDYYLCFTSTLRTSALWVTPYSEYQQFLHDTIKNLHDGGMGYRKIAEWLRDRGYKTVRGKRFYNTHVFSILKKKRVRDGRIRPKHDLEIGPLSIQYVERKLINSN